MENVQVRRFALSMVLVAALTLVFAASRASAECGQCVDCTSGRLCLWNEDGFGGAIQTLQCNNPTLNFSGCGSTCCCICFNGQARSVWNNSSNTFRVFSGTGYTGSNLTLSAGVQLTCAGMGGLCANVSSVRNLTPQCPPCCG